MAPSYVIDFTAGWSCGEPQGKKDEAISVGRIAARAIAVLVVCGFSILLFAETATFHNVRVLQRTDMITPSRQ
jgi:hypothetical protein